MMKFQAKAASFNIKQREGCSLKECFHIEYEGLQSLLRECRHPQSDRVLESVSYETSPPCADCERVFVKEVHRQICGVISCLNRQARSFLRPRISNDIRRCLCRLRYHKIRTEEAHNLITYAASNAIAITKLLTSYNKIHCSILTPTFKSRLQAKRQELLKSPWLIELCAFQINHGEYSTHIWNSCSFDAKFSAVNEPTLTCTLSESMKLEFNLTCPVCLDTAFQPIALGCGHIFCNSCACASASVPTIAGVKAADPLATCPLCRQGKVYANSVHLVQSGLLLKKRCNENWKERLQVERVQRLKEAKEHWDKQSRLFLGF